jgi:hypothetical protein
VVEAVTDCMGRFHHYGSEYDSRRPRLIGVEALGRGPAPRRASLKKIVLPDLASIGGTLVTSGDPPAQLTIALQNRNRLNARGTRRKEWVNLVVRVEKGGRFELKGLPVGQCGVRLLPRYHEVVNLKGHRLKAGETLDLGAVKLEPAGAVEGVLENRGGERVTELVIAKLALRVSPDDEGRFRIDHIPPGTWTLRPRTWQAGTATLTVVVTAGKTTKVVFVLAR